MMTLLSPDQHFMNNLFSQRATAATLGGCCTYISVSFIIEKFFKDCLVDYFLLKHTRIVVLNTYLIFKLR